MPPKYGILKNRKSKWMVKDNHYNIFVFQSDSLLEAEHYISQTMKKETITMEEDEFSDENPCLIEKLKHEFEVDI